MASYMRNCLIKPELGSTWGRDSRISASADSTVRGVGGSETISGADASGAVEGEEAEDLDRDRVEDLDSGSGIVFGCRDTQSRYATTMVAERETPIALSSQNVSLGLAVMQHT